MTRLRRWIQEGKSYLNRPWPIIAFQPVLYLFLWGAFLRLTLFPPLLPGEGIANITAGWTYDAWRLWGLISPPLAWVSWWLITKRDGKQRYRGFWFRLIADFGMFTTMLAYHLAVVTNRAGTIANIIGRYSVAAIMVFLILLIVRDVWTLTLTERIARRLHRE